MSEPVVTGIYRLVQSYPKGDAVIVYSNVTGARLCVVRKGKEIEYSAESQLPDFVKVEAEKMLT